MCLRPLSLKLGLWCIAGACLSQHHCLTSSKRVWTTCEGWLHEVQHLGFELVTTCSQVRYHNSYSNDNDTIQWLMEWTWKSVDGYTKEQVVFALCGVLAIFCSRCRLELTQMEVASLHCWSWQDSLPNCMQALEVTPGPKWHLLALVVWFNIFIVLLRISKCCKRTDSGGFVKNPWIRFWTVLSGRCTLTRWANLPISQLISPPTSSPSVYTRR